MGRADGLGFALLNTKFFGRSGGIEPQAPLFAVEEPNFAGSVGVGFDLFRNGIGCFPHGQGFPDDIGNDNIRPCFSNSLSIHFNGRLIEQFDVSPVIDLASGRWIHARIVIRAGGKRRKRKLSVILTPQGCAPVAVVDRLRIPGLRPYEGRAHFGARSGGETADHDLDNVKVQFLTAAQSLVALDPLSPILSETDARATLTITRLGNTKVPVEVLCTTTNGTAKRKRDYVATSRVVRFPPGRKRAKCRIPLLDDSQAENDEFFFVSLKPASEGVQIGGPSKIAVRLVDNETAAATGHWQPAGCWPVVAIHMHVLPNGKVMAWDRFGTVRTWNPESGEVTVPQQPPHNVFCSGHAFLSDGRLLVTGGHHPEGNPSDDGVGIPNVTLYDPVADAWSDSLPLMNDGRWYPANTALATGDMLVLSGSKDRSFVKNTLPQVWESLVQGWRNLTGAENDALNLTHLGVDLYPRAFQAPDGRVVKVGPDALTSFLDTSGTGQWSTTSLSSSAQRLYGSAVMYEAGEILIVGGSAIHDPGVFPIRAAEKIDLNDANPQWSSAGSLAVGRKHLNATALPDGRVLVTGGTTGSATRPLPS